MSVEGNTARRKMETDGEKKRMKRIKALPGCCIKLREAETDDPVYLDIRYAQIPPTDSFGNYSMIFDGFKTIVESDKQVKVYGLTISVEMYIEFSLKKKYMMEQLIASLSEFRDITLAKSWEIVEGVENKIYPVKIEVCLEEFKIHNIVVNNTNSNSKIIVEEEVKRTKTPEYRVVNLKGVRFDRLVVEVYLPEIKSASDIHLEMTEAALSLYTKGLHDNYSLEFRTFSRIDKDNILSCFEKSKKMLYVIARKK